EEPVWPAEDVDSLGKLRKATGVPLAAGENATGALEFVRLAGARLHYLQPNARENGAPPPWGNRPGAGAGGPTRRAASPDFGARLSRNAAHPRRQGEGGRAGALLLRSRACALWQKRADRGRLGEHSGHPGPRPGAGRRVAGALSRIGSQRRQPLSRGMTIRLY